MGWVGPYFHAADLLISVGAVLFYGGSSNEGYIKIPSIR